MTHDTLYCRDVHGGLRFWRAEVRNGRYRTVSGVQGSDGVTSKWTSAVPKNVGRMNATTPYSQALVEVEAMYRHRLERRYSRSADDAPTHRFFAPMLAQTYRPMQGITPGRVAYVQPKLDGVRMVASADGLHSRQGRPFDLPHLRDALAALFQALPDSILDGELYNHCLRDDFGRIVSLVRRRSRTWEQEEECAGVVQYHVYDMPSHHGGFRERHEAMCDALRSHVGSPSVVVVDHVTCGHQCEVDEQYGEVLRAGYEGQMLRTDDPYQAGRRSYSLLKRKEFEDAEFPISRIIEGEGNWSGHAKSVEFVLPDDRRLEDGSRPRAGIRGDRVFTAGLLHGGARHASVTVRYFQLSPNGVPRFPIAVDWHDGVRDT